MMNDLMLSSLKSYWERLRAGRIAPYRAEIDPREFESALENMFIVEKVSDDNMRIRLAGMKICEMMGMEVRGMQPAYIMDDADRVRFDRLLGVVMAEPSVVELQLAAASRTGSYTATMLLMPLRSDFGEINRVLGCVSGDGDFFNPPLAFAIRDVSVTPIELKQTAEPVEALPGFSEDAKPFSQKSEAPALRAIEGNPEAKPDKKPAARKFRVIESK